MSRFLQTPGAIMGLGNGYFQPLTLQNMTEKDHGLCPPADAQNTQQQPENLPPSPPLKHTDMCACVCTSQNWIRFSFQTQPPICRKHKDRVSSPPPQKDDPRHRLWDIHTTNYRAFSQQINYTKKRGGWQGDPQIKWHLTGMWTKSHSGPWLEQINSKKTFMRWSEMLTLSGF